MKNALRQRWDALNTALKRRQAMRYIIHVSVLAALLAYSGGITSARLGATFGRSAEAAAGPVIWHFPGDIPGPPYYALLGRGFIPADDGWVGIVFTRAPECVPAGFNLLDQFNLPTAFGCALTVEGEAWRRSASDVVPFQIHEQGTGAVPIYFVAEAELLTAIADDLLTIGELQNLPSLQVGWATFLEHVVHNSTQAANHGHETLVSYGYLDDQRSFQFRWNEKFFPETGEHVFPNVRIRFE
jgi:hypothetical protein